MTWYSTAISSADTAGSIANWVNSSQAVAVAPTIISEAESFIYRRLRHWKMLKRATGTMSANPTPVASPTDYIAQPSDYLEDMVFAITGTYGSTLTRKTMQEVIANLDMMPVVIWCRPRLWRFIMIRPIFILMHHRIRPTPIC